MITREDEMVLDYGLNVIFNGDGKYTLMQDHIIKEYPIGGLMCEYVRLHPTDIKEVIMSCEHLEEEPTTDNMGAFFCDFSKHLHEKLAPVPAIMVCLEFMNTSAEWEKCQEKGRGDEYQASINQSDDLDDIKKFIFKDTPYDTIGKATVLQKALSCYYQFATSFAVVVTMFMDLIHASNTDQKTMAQREEIYDGLYSQFLDYQHIDYRIVALEEGFSNMFTIQTSLSLLLFDMANSIKFDVEFNRCPNCKRIFVPEGRRDIVYCSYPSPQNPEKTCREIGAQVTRANKEKSDVVTREYRKVYMRLQMATRRHPGNREAAEKFSRLTDEVISWRESLKNGTKTVEQYLCWLKEFD